MPNESDAPRAWFRRRSFVAGAAAVVLAAGAAVTVWRLNLSGCDDADRVVAETYRLCFPVPEGWERGAPDEGFYESVEAETSIRPMDAGPSHATVPTHLASRAPAALAEEWMDFYSAEANPESGDVATEAELRSFELDGLPAATMALFIDDADEPGAPDLYIRMTVVDAGEPAPSALVSFSSPGLRGTVDEIHDGLAVLPS